ncbi:ankyrin repeat domain-containing protein 54-like [Mizuhopecten yessoensis]|uniref:Ankyrin repeat domain-containing protein 54 n=1 Tax=Mizuhopecten yessoensis TaxID=6573 RepID=A0A210QCK5_MIZYE|nr:ankyrin repeat domain-containing protein 54-like [Mizuhopecten yessoensis]OWF46486.1 Ankyrin repeat domain-containing protein 54 [Mizuhopecten yessoensis]
MDDANDSDSTSSLGNNMSSSEGEYSMIDNLDHEQTDFPKFDMTSWSPKSESAGVDYLCLVPFASNYKPEYDQSFHTGKSKNNCSERIHRKPYSKSNRLDERRLRMAANENDSSLVLNLLESGIDTCCFDEKNRTPLHFAASQGNETIVKALLDKGADPNQKDAVGNTPLHLAACTGKVSIVTLLLKAGTNLQSVDKYGRTPLTVGKSRLKFLSESKVYSSKQVKDETLKICDMMKTYLNLSGMSEDVTELDRLCDKLQQVSTREDVNHVNLLLSDFAGLTLQKKNSS